MQKFITTVFTIAALLVNVSTTNAQGKKPLSRDVYNSWNAIEHVELSNDGRYISYELNPQFGDGKLIINQVGVKADTISRGADAGFSPSGDFITYRIKPTLSQVRKAKLAGKKKDEMPADSGAVAIFGGEKYVFPKLKSSLLPATSGSCVALLIETPEKKAVADTSIHDTIARNKAGKEPDSPRQKSKKKDKTPTFSLKLITPASGIELSRDSIASAYISENGLTLLYQVFSFDSIPNTELFAYNTGTRKSRSVFRDHGWIQNPVTDSEGKQIAFLFSADTVDTKVYSLYYANQFTAMIADTVAPGIQPGLCPGENGKIYFSADGTKLFYGVAPVPVKEPKDTLPDDEKARVDVWHWKDPLLQPQQLKQLGKEKKRTYLSVYLITEGRHVQLADADLKDITTGFKGNGNYALGFNENPYLIETSWKDASYRDVYLVDINTGKREKLLTRHDGPVSLSTTQKYVAWYSKNDSLWHTLNLTDNLSKAHFAGRQIHFYNEEHDIPSLPDAAGMAGWAQNDRYLMVYDGYDIWGLDPGGEKSLVNLTLGTGRNENARYHYALVNRKVPYIGENDEFLLSVFYEDSKDAGFCKLNIKGKPALKLLGRGPFKYSTPIKADGTDRIWFTKGNFNQYPDIVTTKLDFRQQITISDANPQKSEFLWGTVELFNWETADQQKHQGLLYKPENFDTGKKYPLLVYYYEKYADMLNQFYSPKPSRSIINPAYCVSNGYLVFIPDITYKTGFPGQCALDAVISGTNALAAYDFVDTTRMGLQGQSWGGYQTAWIVTRTSKFKAAMAGAPVSNMTSAYGGIRWESGMVREFQYEQGQSRIGATLWERPDLYIENSPLFAADKVETPLLIMSNDGDGAVPWYQGIELFTALRRLNKPAWLLNYNGDEHNLSRRSNMLDLDQRMMQFFDHYLKDAPMPEWMLNGIPAIQKGKNPGFSLAGSQD